MTKKEQANIAAGALAHRLRDKGHTGARLDVALEEAAQEIMFSTHDRQNVSAATLADIWENDPSGRRWGFVRATAKRRLAAMGRPV